MTIGADGFESQVGRWAGIPTNISMRDMDTCLQYRMTNVDCDVRYCDFFLGKVAPGGYVWIFPKGEGLANVGIGVQVSQVTAMADARTYLDRWIDHHPGVREGEEDRHGRRRSLDLCPAQADGRATGSCSSATRRG